MFLSFATCLFVARPRLFFGDLDQEAVVASTLTAMGPFKSISVDCEVIAAHPHRLLGIELGEALWYTIPHMSDSQDQTTRTPRSCNPLDPLNRATPMQEPQTPRSRTPRSRASSSDWKGLSKLSPSRSKLEIGNWEWSISLGLDC